MLMGTIGCHEHQRPPGDGMGAGVPAPDHPAGPPERGLSLDRRREGRKAPEGTAPGSGKCTSGLPGLFPHHFPDQMRGKRSQRQQFEIERIN
jgi:hypothetical protein